MIIDNLYVVGAVLPPFETNTPLFIYSNALPAGPLSTRRFKAITGKIDKVFDTGGAVENL
jgi:hypothetical protein